MFVPPTASRARSWHRYSAVLAGVLTAFALGALGQPPTEVEDPNSKKKKKIEVEDDPIVVKPKLPVPGSDTGTPPDVRSDDLARAAEETKHPALKVFYVNSVYPHDRLTATKGGVVFIKPIPVAGREQLPAKFGVSEVGPNGKVGEPRSVSAADVKKVDSYEELVLADTNALLALKPFGSDAGPDGWTAAEQLEAAERVLAAALVYHDYALKHNIRRGKGWDEIRKPLADRLNEVRRFQVDNVVAEAKRLSASENPAEQVEARTLLDAFEARYPARGDEAIRKIRAEIKALARALFTSAKNSQAANDLVSATKTIKRAAALDPTDREIRALQRELKAGYQTLYVGVNQYPRNMSPATARTDSEKQAVELLFEGLLAEVPDDGTGLRYRPAAAVAMPTVVPNGREFVLRTQERGPNGPSGFDSHDVVSTLKLMKSASQTWSGYVLPWFDELPTPRDSTGVRVTFVKGHPDPRALCTFKLLPAQWMRTNSKPINDAGFAAEPTGTGPYKLLVEAKDRSNPAPERVFVDNPLYGRRWRDRANQPIIKEIRLVDVSKGKVHNLVESFRQGSLHILPDVPTAELDKFMGPAANLSGKVQVHTAATNRRIHVLAVNLNYGKMQSKALRQGLSLAIDREAILTDVFRAGKSEFHRQMGGPFPPRSWASVKGAGGQPVPLLNRDLAVTRLKTFLTDTSVKSEVALLYPDDDPQADLACKKIKEQVEGLFKDGTAGRKLTIVLEPVPVNDLVRRVEDEHRYELAYVPFDYPDEWYPYALGAMLDPAAAGYGERNWTGFRKAGNGADEQDTRLGLLLEELRGYRDFAQLSRKTEEVHKLFNECVPFIPLWQLDRHTLFHNAVKVYTDDSETPVSPRFLNPTILFQGIARWRLEE